MDELQKKIFYYLALNGLENYLNYPDYNKEEKIKALDKITKEAFKNSDNLDNIDREIFNSYYGLSKEKYSITKLVKKLKISKHAISKRKLRTDKIIVSYYLLKILRMTPIDKIKKQRNRLEKYHLYKEEVTRLKDIGYNWKEICKELKINFRTAKKAYDYKIN